MSSVDDELPAQYDMTADAIVSKKINELNHSVVAASPHLFDQVRSDWLCQCIKEHPDLTGTWHSAFYCVGITKSHATNPSAATLVVNLQNNQQSFISNNTSDALDSSAAAASTNDRSQLICIVVIGLLLATTAILWCIESAKHIRVPISVFSFVFVGVSASMLIFCKLAAFKRRNWKSIVLFSSAVTTLSHITITSLLGHNGLLIVGLGVEPIAWLQSLGDAPSSIQAILEVLLVGYLFHLGAKCPPME